MKRRIFIKDASLCIGGSFFMPAVVSANPPKKDWKRVLSNGVEYPLVKFPEGKRIPLGWKAFSVPSTADKDKPVVLRFPEIKRQQRGAWLRITAAIDIREEVIVSAYLPKSNEEIGQFNIRYAHPFQPFQIFVDASFLEKIEQQGLALKMIKGVNDSWFFLPDTTQTDNRGLQPHILLGATDNPRKSFNQNLLSMNSFSPFGWLGGCVHDALWEMSKKGDGKALRVLRRQLGYYLDDEKGIVFENPRTQPIDGTFNSIEDFLPFASIVGLYPEHSSIKNALNFLKTKEGPEGMIVSGNHITTEGCYTVAYPLASMAVSQNDQELAKLAIKQLRFRTGFLTDETAIYQRATLLGEQSYSNWGRGVVWYLLGMIKTLSVLKGSDFNSLEGIVETEQEFKQAARVVEKWQTDTHYWCSYIDRPETGLDASSTAGIAAAFIWGYKLGLLDKEYIPKAQKAYRSLLSSLTPDGFLTNVSQINRGGEALQASSYRVISQFAMGLMAQLAVLLKEFE